MRKARSNSKAQNRVHRRVAKIDNGAGGSRATWTGRPERVGEPGGESINKKHGCELRIGISGWRGKFYPKTLAHRREQEFAVGVFSSVEINGSFYSLQRPSSYRRWYSETPENFLFAVKGGRFITQMKKLRNVETPLANFFGSSVLALREKLGPIL